MKRSREPCEGGSDAPEVEFGLKGAAAAGEGDGDGEAVPDESTLGLRVHEWGLNPLFWVGAHAVILRVRRAVLCWSGLTGDMESIEPGSTNLPSQRRGGKAVSYGQGARHYPHGPLVFLHGSAKQLSNLHKLVLVMNPGLNCSCQSYHTSVRVVVL